MYQNADIIVKIVMIGLAIASIITWTIWIAKGFELMGAKRRLRGEIAALKKATTLKEASATAGKEGTLANLLVHDALEEMRLAQSLDPVSSIVARDLAVVHAYRRDYEAALLQLRVYHALRKPAAWTAALAQARALAGERVVPADLTTLPPVLGSL
jgi:biopolymer transport protein ExbB/TolQ